MFVLVTLQLKGYRTILHETEKYAENFCLVFNYFFLTLSDRARILFQTFTKIKHSI